MKNKKTIMTFSAICILIFHLWINLTNLHIEMYLRQLCVIGVDLFFFISAYSIAKQDEFNYKKFITNRFCKIYLKFIIFSIIAAITYKWEFIRFFKVIFGIEFLIKGGGAFLWFLPAIMIVYLILPFYKKLDYKHPKFMPFITLLAFFIISISISKFTSYRSMFILFNRIPIILLGYYFSKYHIFEYLRINTLKYWITTIIILIVGIALSYLVYITHFRITIFVDFFYILYVPVVIGIMLLLDKIEVNKFSVLISSITLELYGVQMIFGFKIANALFEYINNSLMTNIMGIVIIVIIALLINKILKLIEKYLLTVLRQKVIVNN